jgi:predicted GIY-YIG superfamily endonuclease
VQIKDMSIKNPAIYILANRYCGTLYVGVTSNLFERINQHKAGVASGFANKYGCDLLVYYELFDSIDDAIGREKQLKAGSRNKKIKLIEASNPGWQDLYKFLIQSSSI